MKSISVRQAHSEDVDGIAALEVANRRENGGMLVSHFSREKIVVGFLFTAEPEATDPCSVQAAMLATAQFPGLTCSGRSASLPRSADRT